jgi:hypothetical protein
MSYLVGGEAVDVDDALFVVLHRCQSVKKGYYEQHRAAMGAGGYAPGAPAARCVRRCCKNVTRMCSTYRTLMKQQLGVYGSYFNHHLSPPSSG